MSILKKLWTMVAGPGKAVPMIPCEQVLENLFDYLDGEIDEARAAQIHQHLEMCKRCYPRAQFEKAFLDAVRQAQAGESVPTDVRARVLAAIEAESQPDS